MCWEQSPSTNSWRGSLMKMMMPLGMLWCRVAVRIHLTPVTPCWKDRCPDVCQEELCGSQVTRPQHERRNHPRCQVNSLPPTLCLLFISTWIRKGLKLKVFLHYRVTWWEHALLSCAYLHAEHMLWHLSPDCWARWGSVCKVQLAPTYQPSAAACCRHELISAKTRALNVHMEVCSARRLLQDICSANLQIVQSFMMSTVW